MKFSSKKFPKYYLLSRFERFFLQTSCYFPPKPRRARKQSDVKNINSFINTYENAFSSGLWSICKDKKILDFGCGEGGYVLALAEKGAGKVVGFDIQDQFKYAKIEADRRTLDNISFIQGPSEDLPSEAFDVVISHDSFEHFEDPEYILSEMVRLTKPGGTILIKFGPPWKNPWGRHMSGTIRKDRPWIHLIVPEKVIMRVHSVYHNEPILKEKYAQLDGGLNKMTIKRFKKILDEQEDLEIIQFKVNPIYGLSIFKTPIIHELFSSSVMTELIKVK